MPKILPHLKSDKSVKVFCSLMALFLLSIGIWAGFQLPQLSTSYSVEQFFPKEHPLLTEAEKVHQKFQVAERPAFLIILTPKAPEENWLIPRQMNLLASITQNLESLPGIYQVISLSSIDGIFETEEVLTVGSIFENVAPKEWETYVDHSPLIQSQLLSKDYRSTLLVVQPHPRSAEEFTQLSLDLRKRIQSLAPDVELAIGGVPEIQGRFSKKLYDELKLLLVISLVLFCVVFSALISGRSALLLVLFSLLLANLLIVGGLAFFKVPFFVLLTTLPVIVSIVAVSLVVHCLHRWAELMPEKRSGELSERIKLSWSVLKELALPNFLGSLTTSIGFLSLVTSIVPLIRQYSWTISISVLVVWVLMNLVLATFMVFTTPKLRDWSSNKSLWTLWVLRRSKILFASIAVLTVFFFVMGKGISFSGRLFDDLPDSDSARKVTELIDNEFGGIMGYDLVLSSRQAGYWNQPENLVEVKDLLQEVRKMDTVGSALSATDFLGNNLPTSRQELAELLFLFDMSPSNPVKNFVTPDGKEIRLSMRLRDVEGKKIFEARDKILKRVQSHFGTGLEVSESGLSLRAHTINRQVSESLIYGFWYSLILIGTLIFLIFRSLRWALVACLPNLIPPAVLLGGLALTDTPIKPGIALIFSIALGLAFNNTLYLLSRLRKIQKEKNMKALPLRRTFLQEGNPCLFETLVMFFGFMIFLFSDFQVNQTFGLYMLVSIFSAFLGDLVFLPSALRLFPFVLRGRLPNSPASAQRKKVSRVVISSFFVILVIPFGAKASVVNTETEALLKSVRKKIEARDDQAVIVMKVIEPNGDVKERKLELSTLRDGKFYALARILSPADVKGTSFLAEIGKEEGSQWMYVPSSKQVRRVVGTNRQVGVLGSELTIEDLNLSAIPSAQVKVLNKNDSTVLEVIPKTETSKYSRVLSKLSKEEQLPVRTEYYEKNKLVKTVEFLNYVKMSGNIWRAQLIRVKNLENQRGTDLYLSEIKVNTGLEKEDFSVTALKLD